MSRNFNFFNLYSIPQSTHALTLIPVPGSSNELYIDGGALQSEDDLGLDPDLGLLRGIDEGSRLA